MACAPRTPASTGTHGFQLQDWRRPIVVGRDEVPTFIAIRHPVHRRLGATVWRPRAAPRGAGGGRGAGSGRGGDKEGHVIAGCNAVCRVVLLVVEQAACTKG